MRTILVPTDFSKLSKVAFSYALGLAKKIGARVILLHVNSSGVSTDALSNWKKFEADLIRTANDDAAKLLKEYKSAIGKLDVTFRYISGHPVVQQVDDFAVKIKADLIVMGSKGASGLKKIVMGSNAAAVIDNSSVPVIIVPGEAEFAPIKKLVYASDAKNFAKEAKAVASFSQLAGASMEVLHVVPTGEKAKLTSAEKLAEITRYPNLHLHVVHHNDPAKGVESFIKSQHADMLAMFTHHLSFNEKLFGKSVTRKLALQNTIPLLVFNKSNQEGL